MCGFVNATVPTIRWLHYYTRKFFRSLRFLYNMNRNDLLVGAVYLFRTLERNTVTLLINDSCNNKIWDNINKWKSAIQYNNASVSQIRFPFRFTHITIWKGQVDVVGVFFNFFIFLNSFIISKSRKYPAWKVLFICIKCVNSCHFQLKFSSSSRLRWRGN